MTDDEMVWEPYGSMWSVRRREDVVTADAYGVGDYVLDFIAGGDPFAVAPMSTIAWRIGHLVSMFAGRYEWTFATHAVDPKDTTTFVPKIEMVEQLWVEVDRWAEAVNDLTDAELDQVGLVSTRTSRHPAAVYCPRRMDEPRADPSSG